MALWIARAGLGLNQGGGGQNVSRVLTGFIWRILTYIIIYQYITSASPFSLQIPALVPTALPRHQEQGLTDFKGDMVTASRTRTDTRWVCLSACRERMQK